MRIEETSLTESKSLRDGFLDKEGVLDKVGSLAMLPDKIHATTELVAKFYDVDEEVIKWHVRSHKDELEFNGLRTVRGSDLKQLKEDVSAGQGTEGVELPQLIHPKTQSLTLFNRRTILNVGMLLRDSEVAKGVRNYLLNLEEDAERIQRMMSLRTDERIDYGKILEYFKICDGTYYGSLQDDVYLGLFQMRAREIKETQARRLNVEYYVRGPNKGKVKTDGPAKDHLTEAQMKRLRRFTNAYMNALEELSDSNDGYVDAHDFHEARRRTMVLFDLSR